MEEDTSTSNFLVSNADNMNSTFAECTALHSSGFNLLTRAKRFGRWWVLKGLKEEYRSQKMYQTLLRKEFDIMIQLQHPNIVSTVGFENVADLGPSIVMEWIDGATLKEWLTARHPLRDRLHIARQLMDALRYAHGLQIAHRDLKPSNVMITHNGQNVKLIDFGLSDTDSHAIFKQPAGTEGYIAPELKDASASPQSLSTTAQLSDIYSLGCILDELQLGWLYRGVVNKCCAPQKKRYDSVELVEKSVRRCGVLPRAFLFSFAFAILSVAMFAVGLSLNSGKMDETMARTRQYEKKATAALVKVQKIPSSVNDSLRDLKIVYQANAIKNKRTNDSLHNRIKGLEEQAKSTDNKEEDIKKCIVKGKAMVDRLACKLDDKVRNGDTDNISNEYTETVLLLNDKINSYANGLKFNEMNRNRIKEVLIDYSDNYVTRWVKSMQ